jgi:hypothetical protein
MHVVDIIPATSAFYFVYSLPKISSSTMNSAYCRLLRTGLEQVTLSVGARPRPATFPNNDLGHQGHFTRYGRFKMTLAAAILPTCQSYHTRRHLIMVALMSTVGRKTFLGHMPKFHPTGMVWFSHPLTPGKCR